MATRSDRKHVAYTAKAGAPSSSAINHAVTLVHRVCCLAGNATLIDDLQGGAAGTDLRSIIREHNNAALFDWLVDAVSYQGISDQAAYSYMEKHGRLTWKAIEADIASQPSCPKLRSYWQFHDCRYDKISRTCAEPDHVRRCPLPVHRLRNGRLNQTGYTLYFFFREFAAGNIIGWIDAQLTGSGSNHSNSEPIANLIEPLRQVYGVSDKILMMALSCILISAPDNRPAWFQAGVSMIAIDTLVHNFLHRTGVLCRFKAEHEYGLACYRDGGCADIVRAVSTRIDARQFNPAFPREFPRFVQHAVWRYCSRQGLDICNGNRIDDRNVCKNVYCQLYSICERISLN
jgi:hypothetical protein